MNMFSGMMIPINNIHWQPLDLLSSLSHHDYSHNMHILCQLPLNHFRVIDLFRQMREKSVSVILSLRMGR